MAKKNVYLYNVTAVSERTDKCIQSYVYDINIYYIIMIYSDWEFKQTNGKVLYSVLILLYLKDTNIL